MTNKQAVEKLDAVVNDVEYWVEKPMKDLEKLLFMHLPHKDEGWNIFAAFQQIRESILDSNKHVYEVARDLAVKLPKKKKEEDWK